MDEIPSYLSLNNFNIIVRKLKVKPQLIIIDEIDYLMNDFKTIETLRDIHDKTECPIVFVGMNLVHKKLERYKHLYDRFSEIVKFESFGVTDLKQIFDNLSEILLQKALNISTKNTIVLGKLSSLLTSLKPTQKTME